MTNEDACFEKPVWKLTDLSRAFWSLPVHAARVAPTVFDKSIGGKLREEIMLAVSGVNECWYCQTAHRVFARAEGLTDNEIEIILEGGEAGLDEAESVALEFVRDLARNGFKGRNEELYARMDGLFSEEEKRAIESTAHVINFANRFGNTFDAARTKLLGGCEKTGAGALDMALVSALFLPGALYVSPLVGLLHLKNKFKNTQT